MSKPTGTKQERHKKHQYPTRHPANSHLTCEEEDIVLHRGEEVYVAQVIQYGREDTKAKAGYRSMLSVCRIMENGQVLSRSPFHIGEEWEHPVERRRVEIKEKRKAVSDHLRGINDKVYGMGSGARCRGGAE